MYFIQIKCVCVSVCVTDVMSLPIWGPISACKVRLQYNWPPPVQISQVTTKPWAKQID